jgi:8-oxo-dGTP pyrophosphatase MutT (NUDIX family)
MFQDQNKNEGTFQHKNKEAFEYTNNHVKTGEYHQYHKSKNIMCINCGRIGHENKTCQEPKTSFGIINIKMDLPEKYRNFLLAQFTVPHQPIIKLKSRVHPDIQCIISNGIKITQELYHNSDQPEYVDATFLAESPVNTDNWARVNLAESPVNTGNWVKVNLGESKPHMTESLMKASSSEEMDIPCDDDPDKTNVTENKRSNSFTPFMTNDSKKIKIGNYTVAINIPNNKSKICFEYIKNNVQFMMVSRKFSLAIISFLKGNYNPNDTASIIAYFRNMMQYEIDLIKNNEYDDLVFIVMNKNNLSKEDFLKTLYEGSHSIEYESAKQKFNRLRNPDKDDHGIYWTLQVYTDIKPNSTEPEWGFPKGKRNGKIESNIECAIREFTEETGFTDNEFIVMNNIEPLTEYIVGSDDNMYRGVYYLAFNNSSDDKSLEYDYYETGEIRYFSIEEAIKVIRPYHVGKIRILLAIYNFLINYLINLMTEFD